MRSEAVVIVGGGLAGLHAGCILASRGIDSILLEKNLSIGGYCSGYSEDGYQFDIGATMLQTPDVLTEAFEGLERELSRYLELVPLDPIYRVRFADGSCLDFTRSVEQMTENIAHISGPDAIGFRRYIRDMDSLKKALKQFFINKQQHGLFNYFPGELFTIFRHLNPLSSVSRLMCNYFSTDKIRNAFSFQVLYFGVPPHRCSAVYGMVPYFEITQGVWYVRGGLKSISNALASIFQEEGGQVRMDCAVERILTAGGRVRGVRLQSGEELKCSRVISNANAVYTYLDLLPHDTISAFYRRRLERYRLSCSAHVILLGVRRTEEHLLHHNFFMPNDPDGVYRSIFDSNAMPTELSAYVCDATRTDPGMAPPGKDSLYILTPAPGRLRDHSWEDQREQSVHFVLQELEQRGLRGLRQCIEVQKVFLPADYESTFKHPSGSAFGIQPSPTQFGPFLPKARSPYVGGLYLAGASTNPGCGIPLVLASGRTAAQAVLHDLSQ